MTISQAILLGIIQGLTEFLPISSSGHLVLAKSLLNVELGGDITFEVFVHFGTFMSVLIIFWRDVSKLFISVIEGFSQPKQIANTYRTSESFRLAFYVLIGCIPAGIVGILFDSEIELLFSDSKLTGLMLIITGIFLFFTNYSNEKGDGKLRLGASIGIGIAQAIAIIPGISRSGATISAALYLGISKENAAVFSFLMALPIIFGATVLKVKHILFNPPHIEHVFALLVGTIIAFITAYLAIRFLLSIIKRGKFAVFSYYCFAVGIIGLIFIE